MFVHLNLPGKLQIPLHFWLTFGWWSHHQETHLLPKWEENKCVKTKKQFSPRQSYTHSKFKVSSWRIKRRLRRYYIKGQNEICESQNKSGLIGLELIFFQIEQGLLRMITISIKERMIYLSALFGTLKYTFGCIIFYCNFSTFSCIIRGGTYGCDFTTLGELYE